MVVRTFGSALHGVEALSVTIEVSVVQGTGCYVVGLADNAIRESLMRIEIAMRSIETEMPRQKIVINLAPADIQKTGTGFDLAIALGILGASGQMKNYALLKDFMICGELGLDGSMQPVKGALPAAIRARSEKLRGIIVPKQNEREAALVNNIKVYGFSDLKEVVRFFNGGCVESETPTILTREVFFDSNAHFEEDFSEVKGQESMKRVLEIAAAGGHNVIMVGPPGSSKTMLAKRLPTIMPPLTLQESLETTRVHSVAGLFKSGRNHAGLIATRPFRSPHHTCSDIALSGGGSIPQPGEISLAHNGVLFMDELPEFKRAALEVLRQPLEDKKVLISRSKMSLEFPASFMLVAAMNPCPCGYLNHPDRKCTCTPFAVAKYIARISGPLLDRIDLQYNVAPVPFFELDRQGTGESSSVVRARVIKARERQVARNGWTNSNMSRKQILEYCELDEASKKLLYKSMDTLQLSARAYERILKVCRTIADLAGCEQIKIEHVAEAIHYRSLDQQRYTESTQPVVRKMYPENSIPDEERAYRTRMGVNVPR